MKRTVILPLAVLCLLLAACSPAAATQANPTQAIATSLPITGATATSQPSATQAEATSAAPASTAEPGAQPGGADDVRTFRILPEQSTVSYSVGEIFFNENNRFNLAVGTTQEVNGEVYVNMTNPEQSSVGTITVDISSFTSDSSRRDNAIRNRWLESATYPLATFVPTQVSGLSADVQAGETVNLQISGDMTVREVTRPVTFDVQVRLENDLLQGTATTEVLMTDFGFTPPDIVGMLRAEDKVKIDFAFTAAE